MTRFLPLALLLALAMPASAQTFVVNQGNFSDGNGSVTVLNRTATQLYEGQLGSILQSATAALNANVYLVANSANRIEIVNPSTLARIGQIGGGDASPFSSPRYIEISEADETKAFVSNQVYFGGSSYVVPVTLEGNGGTAETPIEVEGSPETMAWVGDSLYVALGSGGALFGGSDSLAVISTTANELVGYIDLDCYARFVIFNGADVLAFCESTDEMLVIDQQTRSVTQRLAFEEEIGDPSSVGQTVGYGPQVYLVRSASGWSAPPNYVITASGVALVSAPTQEPMAYAIVSRIPIPNVATQPISAVAFTGRHIALGRPDPDNPFTADGTITIHNPTTGELVATYPAGIYPAHIVPPSVGGTASEQEAAARALNLELAGPNPARGASALAFTLRQPEDARVTVHDLLGRTVATVADRAFGAGDQRVELDVSGLAPGPYRVRLTVGDRVASLPLTVVR